MSGHWLAIAQQTRGDFLEQLGCNHCRHIMQVAMRVKFDNIGPDELAFEPLDQRNHLARRKPAGFVM